MQFKSATNPQFGDAAKSFINLQATFLVGPAPVTPEEGEEAAPDTRTEVVLPYTATASDSNPVGRDLFARAIAKEFGPVKAYVAPPVPVPSRVTRFQARAALYQAGHLAAVETFMADPATPMLYKLAWQDAAEFERTSPTVAALASVLALTSAQVDALFIAAAGISA